MILGLVHNFDYACFKYKIHATLFMLEVATKTSTVADLIFLFIEPVCLLLLKDLDVIAKCRL